MNLDELARRTEGYASVEVSAMCQTAAKIPLRERIKEKKPRRQLAMADFEQAIKGLRTVLAAWYAKAAEDLPSLGEAEMFSDLIQAAKDYHEH